MKILGLDPASHVTGYALLDGLDARDLLDVGVIRYGADWLREQVGELKRASRLALARHMASKDLAAWMRCRYLAAAVRELLDEMMPDAVAIEVPDGLVGTGAKHGASGALTSYGMAVGRISGAVEDWRPKRKRKSWRPPRIVPIGVRQWTAGGGDKQERIAAIAAQYPSEQWATMDQGGDARDAIGIARFGLILLGKE